MKIYSYKVLHYPLLNLSAKRSNIIEEYFSTRYIFHEQQNFPGVLFKTIALTNNNNS